MELEIGVKITQTRADITSTADLRIAKEKSGFIFLSKETETAFILTAHLQGYGQDNIDIAINEDGSQIVISGNMPVQEKLMHGWLLHKEENKLKEFQKVFLIPEGVILDKIKAKFKENTSTLTIFMPKSVKGLSGQQIEEIKEAQADTKQAKHQKDHELVGKTKGRDQLERAVERQMTTSHLDKQIPYDREQAPQADADGSNKQWEKEKEEEKPKTMDETLDKSKEEELNPEVPPTSICREPYYEVQNEEEQIQGSKSKLQHENLEVTVHGNQSSQSERIAHSPSSKPTVDIIKLHLEQHEGDESNDQDHQGENIETASPNHFPQHAGDDNNNANPPRNSWSKCKHRDPAIIGTALLVSLLIIVTQLIRTKRK